MIICVYLFILSKLENEKTRREEEIQTMYDCLNPLWDKLDVSEEEREEFINQHMGSTLEVIDAVSC